MNHPYKIKKSQITAVLVAMATLGSVSIVRGAAFYNDPTSFSITNNTISLVNAGTLPAGIQTVIDNLTAYKGVEQGLNNGFAANVTTAQSAVDSQNMAITAKTATINNLITANPLDPQIAVEQANLATLQMNLVPLNTTLTTANSAKTNSNIKIALYTQAITVPVAAAKQAAADAAAAITKAQQQYATGGDKTDPKSTITGTAGLQSVVDAIQAVTAGNQTPVVTAIQAADTTFAGIGAANATIANIQALVGTINTQLPTLPPIDVATKTAVLGNVLNGSYERNAIDTIQSTGIKGVAYKDNLGRTHIGTNSLIVDDTAAAGAGNINLTANDFNGNPAKITVATDFAVTGDTVMNGDLAVAGIITQGGVQVATVNNVAVETTRATTAEGVLQTNINTETTRATSAEGAEVVRATAAEGLLQTNINTETTRATSVERSLSNRIDKNTRGIAMVAALSTPVVSAGKHQAVNFGAASFQGETGLAAGYAYRINENLQINASAASTSDFKESVARIGANYEW